MERSEAVITGVVLAGMCGVIAVLVLLGREIGPDVAASPVEPSAIEGTIPVLTDLDYFVLEAIEFVETTRGRSFVRNPVVLALTEADFVARVEDDFAAGFKDSPEDLEMLNAIYRSTGLISPQQSIDEVLQVFGAAGIIGFYDPETDELVVRQIDDLSLLTKSTIVHELAHAFDDQHFNLDRPEYDDRTDEVPWTFRATAEGSANWVEAAWEATLTEAQRGRLFNEESTFGDPGAFDAFELSYLMLEFSVYELGEAFVEDLIETGGVDALDAALTEPPFTSEQVEEWEAFSIGEIGRLIDPPPADGNVQFEGAGGQVLIRSLFRGNGIFLPFEWGGDQMTVWDDGGLSCFRWDIQSDTPAGLDTLRELFDQWVATVGSGSVRLLDSATIRVDRCV
jgi:hypothetical protein